MQLVLREQLRQWFWSGVNIMVFDIGTEKILLMESDNNRLSSEWQNKGLFPCKLQYESLGTEETPYVINIPPNATFSLDGNYKGNIWAFCEKGNTQIEKL